MGFMFRQRIVGTRIKCIHNRLYKLAQNQATTSGVKRFAWYYRLNASLITLAQKAFEPLARITLAPSLKWSHLDTLCLIWQVTSPLIASRYVRRLVYLLRIITLCLFAIHNCNASRAERQAIYRIL